MDSNAQSFILKFWVDPTSTASGKDVHWHGQITHVPSGARRSLKNREDLLNFIHPYLEAIGIHFTQRRRFWRRER
ncbi:MAG TPA: hypothetical protein VHH35_05650 [Pyrinomonadaceae bacterium]|nr:hypothetical protein [Pyrinomonadaceae bacterium]